MSDEGFNGNWPFKRDSLLEALLGDQNSNTFWISNQRRGYFVDFTDTISL